MLYATVPGVRKELKNKPWSDTCAQNRQSPILYIMLLTIQLMLRQHVENKLHGIISVIAHKIGKKEVYY